MKKLVFLFCTLSLILTTQLSAQSTQDRNVGNFDGIQVSAGIDLYLKQGGSTSVKVKAKSDVIDDIVTQVENGKLIIKMNGKNYCNWGNTGRNEVYVVVNDLKYLSASVGSDVISENLELDELTLNTSGGSDVSMEIQVNVLKISASGGSDINLSGSAQQLDVKANGGSDLSAKKLKVKNCEINTSGASDASIYVTGDLSMSASGASDINYSGNPNVITSRTSGGADITKN